MRPPLFESPRLRVAQPAQAGRLTLRQDDPLDALLRTRLAGARQAAPSASLWERIEAELDPGRPSLGQRAWSWLWGPMQSPDVFADYPTSLQWFATRGLARVC
jgi:hypothetical protein